MDPSDRDHHALRAAMSDARDAETEFDDARAWLDAAMREGGPAAPLGAELLEVPAAVVVRRYQCDHSVTLGLSYGAVVSRALPLAGESGQPVAWVPLDHDWEGVFPEDRPRIRAYAGRLSLRRASR